MNSVTKTLGLPPLTSDLLNQAGLKIDNTFSTTWKNIGFNNLKPLHNTHDKRKVGSMNAAKQPTNGKMLSPPKELSK